MIAEKSLKAVISERKNEIPPKSHDLLKLAKYGDIFDDLSEKQFQLFDSLTPLQIEARYPEYKDKIARTLTKDYCKQLLNETERFLDWIKKQL